MFKALLSVGLSCILSTNMLLPLAAGEQLEYSHMTQIEYAEGHNHFFDTGPSFEEEHVHTEEYAPLYPNSFSVENEESGDVSVYYVNSDDPGIEMLINYDANGIYIDFFKQGILYRSTTVNYMQKTIAVNVFYGNVDDAVWPQELSNYTISITYLSPTGETIVDNQPLVAQWHSESTPLAMAQPTAFTPNDAAQNIPPNLTYTYIATASGYWQAPLLTGTLYEANYTRDIGETSMWEISAFTLIDAALIYFALLTGPMGGPLASIILDLIVFTGGEYVSYSQAGTCRTERIERYWKVIVNSIVIREMVIAYEDWFNGTNSITGDTVHRLNYADYPTVVTPESYIHGGIEMYFINHHHPNHAYSNACDDSCDICGFARSVSHDYAPANCTTPQKCRICGATTGSALGHSYAAATCTKAKTCTRCGATSGSALGHNWVTSGGVRKCSRCPVMMSAPLPEFELDILLPENS